MTGHAGESKADYQARHGAFMTDSGCAVCGEPFDAACHYPFVSAEQALAYVLGEARRTVEMLTSMAWDWRMDWSDFDGRTLVRQVDDGLAPLLGAMRAAEAVGSSEGSDG